MRFVIEEPCEHGRMEAHGLVGTIHGEGIPECYGGTSTKFEGLPEDMIERAARAIRKHNFGVDYWPDDWAQRKTWTDQAQAALEAALGLGHDQ